MMAAQQERPTIRPGRARREKPKATQTLKGRWKRRLGVATRYELELAIARLMLDGRVEVSASGFLRLGRLRLALARAPSTREERWAREDEELRAFCERIDVHETKSAGGDFIAADAGSAVVGHVMRAPPRPAVARYVLEELRRASGDPMSVDDVVGHIVGEGGLEWTVDEHMPTRKAKAAKP